VLLATILVMTRHAGMPKRNMIPAPATRRSRSVSTCHTAVRTRVRRRGRRKRLISNDQRSGRDHGRKIDYISYDDSYSRPSGGAGPQTGRKRRGAAALPVFSHPPNLAAINTSTARRSASADRVAEQCSALQAFPWSMAFSRIPRARPTSTDDTSRKSSERQNRVLYSSRWSRSRQHHGLQAGLATRQATSSSTDLRGHRPNHRFPNVKIRTVGLTCCELHDTKIRCDGNPETARWMEAVTSCTASRFR